MAASDPSLSLQMMHPQCVNFIDTRDQLQNERAKRIEESLIAAIEALDKRHMVKEAWLEADIKRLLTTQEEIRKILVTMIPEETYENRHQMLIEHIDERMKAVDDKIEINRQEVANVRGVLQLYQGRDTTVHEVKTHQEWSVGLWVAIIMATMGGLTSIFLGLLALAADIYIRTHVGK